MSKADELISQYLEDELDLEELKVPETSLKDLVKELSYITERINEGITYHVRGKVSDAALAETVLVNFDRFKSLVTRPDGLRRWWKKNKGYPNRGR